MDIYMKMKLKKYKVFLCLMLAIVGILAITLKLQNKEKKEVLETIQLVSKIKSDIGLEEIGEYDLYAKAAVLMDADSGRILYSKNGDSPLPMASTTKIMTCIITLEYGNLEDMVTVSKYAASQPKVHLGMSKGNTYKLRDLLFSLMLESHNDSAVAIAEHIGENYVELPTIENRTTEESARAVEAFAELMNQKAKDIGCSNTYFITPNGLDATQTITLDTGETVEKQHATTAADLALIMRYCIEQSTQSEKFLEITRTSTYAFTDGTGKRTYSCVNHNSFLSMMEGALSGKTGFTNAAGYCYVGALRREGKTFTVALLACGWPNNKTWKWADTKKLMNYGLNNYEYHSFSEVEYRQEDLKPIVVSNGQTDKIGQIAYTRIEKLEEGRGTVNDGLDILADFENDQGILLRADERIRVICQLQENLEAPIEKGENVGVIQYMVGNKIYKSESIVTVENVSRIDFRWCFGQVWKLFSI